MGLILDSSVLIAAERKGSNAPQALSEIAQPAAGEGDDFEAGDHLEVTQVSSRNTVSKLQCRDPYQQVCESETDTLRRVLPVDLSSSQVTVPVALSA
jgi:hypothetical protein